MFIEKKRIKNYKNFPLLKISLYKKVTKDFFAIRKDVPHAYGNSTRMIFRMMGILQT